MRALLLEKLIFSKFLNKFLLSWNSNLHFQVRKSQPSIFTVLVLNLLYLLKLNESVLMRCVSVWVSVCVRAGARARAQCSSRFSF